MFGSGLREDLDNSFSLEIVVKCKKCGKNITIFQEKWIDKESSYNTIDITEKLDNTLCCEHCGEKRH